MEPRIDAAMREYLRNQLKTHPYILSDVYTLYESLCISAFTYFERDELKNSPEEEAFKRKLKDAAGYLNFDIPAITILIMAAVTTAMYSSERAMQHFEEYVPQGIENRAAKVTALIKMSINDEYKYALKYIKKLKIAQGYTPGPGPNL